MTGHLKIKQNRLSLNVKKWWTEIINYNRSIIDNFFVRDICFILKY